MTQRPPVETLLSWAASGQRLVEDTVSALEPAAVHEPSALPGWTRGHASLAAETWPGTGRVQTVPMYGLTVAESQGRPGKQPFLDVVAAEGTDALSNPADPPDLAGYLDLALASGYPEPLLLRPARSTARWLASYVEQLITRDAPELEPGRDPDRLRRYFEALALNTAGFVEQTTLAEAAGVDKRTAAAYEQLLRNLLVVDALPAWTTNRLKRLVRGPKRHLTDVALLAGAVGVDTAAVLRDGVLLGADARHLAWLRDEYGDRFLAGIVLHAGPYAYELGDRIGAAPIAALWN